MPDLATTMKANPKMKVLLAGGYYDLATPFFEGVYEMRHLPIPQSLQANITYRYYEAGHMVYVNEGVLKKFHDDVASFIRGTTSAKYSSQRGRYVRSRARDAGHARGVDIPAAARCRLDPRHGRAVVVVSAMRTPARSRCCSRAPTMTPETPG
jgi:hypothetical protein